MEPDRDFANPFVSEPMRPIVPARALERPMCSTNPDDEPKEPVRVFAMPFVSVLNRDNEPDSVL